MQYSDPRPGEARDMKNVTQASLRDACIAWGKIRRIVAPRGLGVAIGLTAE